jgi:hypothetical protein
MSPAMDSIRSAPRFSPRRDSIARELSMPTTRTARSASGSAMRPVPIANSSALPSPANSASLSNDHSRIEHARRVLVIFRSDALAEVPLARLHRAPVSQDRARSGR